mmetsp:Transcript_54139/g.162077  ORF Transcript_54139/g.162077 Transcript_54139/m.162077 type:complete len:174 (-) Transcript_54139:1983-2504(-)
MNTEGFHKFNSSRVPHWARKASSLPSEKYGHSFNTHPSLPFSHLLQHRNQLFRRKLKLEVHKPTQCAYSITKWNLISTSVFKGEADKVLSFRPSVGTAALCVYITLLMLRVSNFVHHYQECDKLGTEPSYPFHSLKDFYVVGGRYEPPPTTASSTFLFFFFFFALLFLLRSSS